MGQVSGYRIADYLLQYASRERKVVKPPASLWEACAKYLADPGDASRVASVAHRRQLYRYAVPLYQNALAHAPEVTSNVLYHIVRPLANLLGEMGRGAEVIDLVRPYADEGGSEENVALAFQLAKLLAQLGREKELRARAKAGDGFAISFLGELLAESGRAEEAIHVMQPIGRGRLGGAQLDEILASLGREEELKARADSGHSFAILRLFELLIRADRTKEATAFLRAQAATANGTAVNLLADLVAVLSVAPDRLANASIAPQLKALVVESLPPDRSLPVIVGPERRAEMLGRLGRVDEAIGLLRPYCTPPGPTGFDLVLDQLLTKQGREEELRARAAGSCASAAAGLAYVLANSGRVGEAIELLRSRAYDGDFDAVSVLQRLLYFLGRKQESEKLRQFGLELDGSIPGGLK
jgi:hypothetical protein